jgi:hypothetical protein
VPAFRLLRQLIGLILLAACLTTPATAWQFHQIAHQNCSVAFDVRHTHDNGQVVMEHHHQAGNDRHHADDHGHDHMLSLLAGLCGTLPEAISLEAPAMDRLDPPSFAALLPPNRTEAPPPRPPRIV